MTLACGRAYRYWCRWIDPPHHKRGICICDSRSWFFWFNTDAAFHGVAQMAVTQVEFPAALTKDCFLDLSELLCASPQELAGKDDYGPIPDPLRQRILQALSTPIRTLADANRHLAITNLTPQNPAA